MKMRDILIVLGLVSVLSVSAQTLAQQPSNEFQSTSTMKSSGSAYSANPMLNADGTAAYGEQQAPTHNSRPGQPRKAIDPSEEAWVPLGDAVWPLMLLAAVYGVWCMVYRRRKRRV